jgi:hypothetical protein
MLELSLNDIVTAALGGEQTLEAANTIVLPGVALLKNVCPVACQCPVPMP